MPKTRQDPEKRKMYAKQRTLHKPMSLREMMSPLKTIANRKRVVYGDKKK